MSEANVGDTVKAGTLLLFTSGCYSNYGVYGLWRAKADFVVPGKQGLYDKPGHLQTDTATITSNPEWVEEVEYTELWHE